MRHLEQTRDAMRRMRLPKGFDRRDAERAELDRCDFALLDLLTVALDTADEPELQMLVAYARTSAIIAITRSDCRGWSERPMSP